MKVIFEPLEREKWWIRLNRHITNRPRKNEHISLSLNGKKIIIKRGAVVDIPKEFLLIASYAPKHWKYNWRTYEL